MRLPKDLKPYLSGENLLGDDYTPSQLKEWYSEEAEGYSSLVKDEIGEISYALNKKHFGKHLKNNLIGLALGPAEGTALYQLTPHIKKWFALEPSKTWQDKKYYQRPVTFIPVNYRGIIDLPDRSVDVIVALSVLHHIANVSFILNEFKRVLKPGGFIFIREPIVTMGDWTKLRKGLTPNERGIPLPWLREALGSLNFKIIQEKMAVFPPFDRLVRAFGMKRPYASPFYVSIDGVLSWLFKPFIRYYRPKWYYRFAPAAVLMIVRKV